jgi:hypothetical protein
MNSEKPQRPPELVYPWSHRGSVVLRLLIGSAALLFGLVVVVAALSIENTHRRREERGLAAGGLLVVFSLAPLTSAVSLMVNHTRVRLLPTAILIEHGPIPFPGAHLERSEISAFEVVVSPLDFVAVLGATRDSSRGWSVQAFRLGGTFDDVATGIPTKEEAEELRNTLRRWLADGATTFVTEVRPPGE